MWVRMHTETNVDNINRETSPVRLDINDHGVPEGVPALRWYQYSLEKNPWIRRRFGHLALIDPWGQSLLGIGYSGDLNELEQPIAKFHETASELSARNECTATKASCTGEELPEHLRRTHLSVPVMTAYELAFDHWLEVVNLVTDPDNVAPGVRNAVIHSFGDFLDTDPADYEQDKLRSIGIAVRVLIKDKARDIAEPELLKRSLHERAAIGLVRILSLPIDIHSPDLVEQTQAWWSEHRNDQDYRIEWSDDPKLKYAFLR